MAAGHRESGAPASLTGSSTVLVSSQVEPGRLAAHARMGQNAPLGEIGSEARGLREEKRLKPLQYQGKTAPGMTERVGATYFRR
jgi:hypothetical protein